MTIWESPSASLDEAVTYYEKALGLKCEHREEVPSQKVRTAFFSVGECIWNCWNRPARKAPLPNFWRRTPLAASITLLSAATILEAQLKQASGAGVKLIHDKPFEGAAGKLVAFLHPKSTFGVLTELCMGK